MIIFTLRFQGVRAMTVCVGILKEVVSLIPELQIKQLGAFTISHFLGRVFGLLRFLEGLHSFCGQQLGVGFLRWIILWGGFTFSELVLYVS